MTSMKEINRASFAIVLCLIASALFGQTTTGTVSGSLADSSGAQIPGATVRIINSATHETRTATTSATGDYLFPSVPTGEYVLETESHGFKTERQSGIKVDVNQNARVDFTLQVGQATEVVQVTSDAPLVDTRDVQLGGTVDRQRVQDLPLNGRNVYDLTALMPGAVIWNVSTFKDIHVFERAQLEFRTDFFNIFNEVNLNKPNATLTSANFGRITSAGAPRILQFGAKLLF